MQNPLKGDDPTIHFNIEHFEKHLTINLVRMFEAKKYKSDFVSRNVGAENPNTNKISEMYLEQLKTQYFLTKNNKM